MWLHRNIQVKSLNGNLSRVNEERLFWNHIDGKVEVDKDVLGKVIIIIIMIIGEIVVRKTTS